MGSDATPAACDTESVHCDDLSRQRADRRAIFFRMRPIANALAKRLVPPIRTAIVKAGHPSKQLPHPGSPREAFTGTLS